MTFPSEPAEQHQGLQRDEERRRAAEGRRRSEVQRGRMGVNSTSLLWCTSSASSQRYKAAFVRLALTPAKRCFCWKSFFRACFPLGEEKAIL